MVDAADAGPQDLGAVTAAGESLTAEVRAAIRHHAERLVEITAKLIGERDSTDEGWRASSTSGSGARR